MGAIRLIAAPIRRVASSHLFQFAVVVAIILLLDHYSYDYAVLRPVADSLKNLVTATVQLCSDYFRVGILTDPVLQVALMIAYVYVVCLLIFFALRHAIRKTIDLVGWSNFCGCATPLRASAASRPTKPGCRSSGSGRRTVRRTNGKSNTPGPPITGRHTRHGRSGSYAA